MKSIREGQKMHAVAKRPISQMALFSWAVLNPRQITREDTPFRYLLHLSDPFGKTPDTFNYAILALHFVFSLIGLYGLLEQNRTAVKAYAWERLAVLLLSMVHLPWRLYNVSTFAFVQTCRYQYGRRTDCRRTQQMLLYDEAISTVWRVLGQTYALACVWNWMFIGSGKGKLGKLEKGRTKVDKTNPLIT